MDVCFSQSARNTSTNNKDDRKGNNNFHDNDHRTPNKMSYVYQVWQDFTETTTLHGLRFIFMNKTFFLRRLFWSLLLVLCTGIMCTQIIDRILFYNESPVNVNVKINYNHSLVFPAVTFCNQNAFKSTTAAAMGLYRLIEAMYSGPLNQFNSSLLLDFNATHLPTSQLFKAMGHRKDDLIVRCSWGDEPCGPDNFTTVLTDHGLCYTFNHMTDKKGVKLATSTGSQQGLKLLLNVEQYEYMPGPNDAAGIKILTHDQHDFPRVRELGVSVPTGTHAFIGLQVVVIKNQEPPYGECNDKPLDYFTGYSYDSCILECKLNYFKGKCGCRQYYMPSDSDDNNAESPVCTLQQFFECYLPLDDHVVEKECSCPNSCHYLMFDPTLSYATTSEHSTAKILSTANSKALKRKLVYAREISHRMERNKITKFWKLVTNLKNTLLSLESLVQNVLQEKINAQLDLIQSESEYLLEQWRVKKRLYNYQEYNVRKNFVRARDAMEERTFGHLCFDFYNFANLVESNILSLAYDFNDTNAGQMFYSLTNNILDGGLDTAQRALDNYTTLFDAYQNGTPIFNYKYPGIPRSHSNESVPKYLLSRALVHNWYTRKYSFRVGDDIRQTMEVLNDVKIVLNHTFHGKLDTSYLRNLSRQYTQLCKDYYHSKSVFYFEGIEWPLRVIERRKGRFDKNKLLYQESFGVVHDNLMNLQQSLSFASNRIIATLRRIVMITGAYFKNQSLKKMHIAKLLSNKELVKALSSLKSSLFEIRNRGQNIYDGWSDLLEKTTAIWQQIIEDQDMVNYYEFTENYSFLRNFSVVSEHLRMNFSYYRDDHDLRSLLNHKDTLFFEAYQELREHLAEFVQSTVIDTSVLRNNYLELDIFYRELNYQEIEQQKAYDLFALLCDIGGSMGLFVGASVMTIFEVFDLITNASAEKYFARQSGT